MRTKIRTSKRLIDIIFTSIILILTAPFIILALILIKINQILRGRPFDPLFYSEIRFSYGLKFRLYKLNIFKHELILEARNSNEFIHTKKLEHNDGLTRVGWFLKQIYMDELPQFFSVLKGDMSIVGPRPYNIEVHETAISNGLAFRDTVPAGITGNYQSHKETVGAESHTLDKEYVDYYHTQPWSKLLLFDLIIILRTIGVILRAKGI